MKKPLLIAFLLIVACSVNAQKVALPLTPDSLIEYSQVVKLNDSTIKQHQLYSISRAWFGNAFVNSKYVLQVEDENAGRLLAKASSTKGYDFTIEVLVKDGRYKYRIYDLKWNAMNNRPFSTSEVSSAYLRYLHNKPENLGFESKKKALVIYDRIFFDLNADVNANIAALQSGIIKQKKADDF